MNSPDDFPSCLNHVEAAPVWECSMCHRLFCEQCVRHKRSGNATVRFCLSCGGVCSGISPAAEQAVEETGPGGFLRAFSYPLDEHGLVLLGVGTIFFAMLQVLSLVPVLGLLVPIFATGYLSAYLLHVIAASAHGEARMPPWPQFEDYRSTLLVPAIQVLGTSLFCLAPAILFGRFGGELRAAYPWIQWILFAAGLLYLPMGLLGVALYQSMEALNPFLVVRSILRVPGQYLIVCGLFAGTAAAGVLIERYAWEFIPLFGRVLGGFVSLYALVVSARLLGLIHHLNRDALGWN